MDSTNRKRIARCPDHLDQVLKPVDESEVLAKSIVHLSNLYHGKRLLDTLWGNPDLIKAYLAYFLPLNALRASAVIEEASKRGFFDGLTDIIELGSGPGTLELAWPDELRAQFKSWQFVESSRRAHEVHEKLTVNSNFEYERLWLTSLKGLDTTPGENTLVAMSYSLNELDKFPEQLLDSEALLIIEPSTRHEARELLKLRNLLINCGYTIYAPCTHQGDCPLLTESKTDWCHDRVFVEMPDWFREMEEHLPMKNRSVTFSYLLARKTPPKEKLDGWGRLIGDTQKEKGKFRQMVCRGEKREFLAWLTRHGEPEVLPRGSLLKVDPEWPTKSNEIRPNSN